MGWHDRVGQRQSSTDILKDRRRQFSLLKLTVSKMGWHDRVWQRLSSTDILKDTETAFPPSLLGKGDTHNKHARLNWDWSHAHTHARSQCRWNRHAIVLRQTGCILKCQMIACSVNQSVTGLEMWLKAQVERIASSPAGTPQAFSYTLVSRWEWQEADMVSLSPDVRFHTHRCWGVTNYNSHAQMNLGA